MSVTRALILLNVANDKLHALMGNTSNAGPQKQLWEQLLPLHQKIEKIEKEAEEGGVSLSPEQSAVIKDIESQIRSMIGRFPASKSAGKERQKDAPAKEPHLDFEAAYRALGDVLTSVQKASTVAANLVVFEESLRDAKMKTEHFMAGLDKAESGDRRALEWFWGMFRANETFRFKDIKVQDENGQRPVRSVDDLLLLKQTKPKIFAKFFAKARGTYYRKERAKWDPSEPTVPKRTIVDDRDRDMRDVYTGVGKSVQPIKAMEYSRTDASRNTLVVKKHRSK